MSKAEASLLSASAASGSPHAMYSAGVAAGHLEHPATTPEHLRCPLQRCVAGEACRTRGEQREDPHHWISGTPGRAVPSRFGRSLGSGICPGLRGRGRFPLAPRCPRLARPCPHLRAEGKGQVQTSRRQYPRNWYGARPVPLFLVGPQFVSLRSRRATGRWSLCVRGDNKECTQPWP